MRTVNKFVMAPYLLNLETQAQGVLPPIDAYDAFAPYYSSYSETKRPYLCKVEEVVIKNIFGSRSLLDVGSGDGSRALRIAASANIGRLVMLEPSAGMRAQCMQDCEIWPHGPLEIPDDYPPFEAITCLWNVLGHIQGMEQRVLVLSKLKRFLAPGGVFLLDVTHRYNASSFGWSKTLFRAVGDLLSRSCTRGDVIVTWRAGAQTIRTYGHVFTHREMQKLCASAGLRIQERWVISSESGRQRKLALAGNLLYKLARA